MKFTMNEGKKCPEMVTILDMSESDLKEIDLDILGFDHMEELILDKNPELLNLPEELAYLPNIRKVSMVGCNSVLLEQLSVFENLESLNISEMHIQDIEVLNTIGRLKTLKELKMNDCTHPYMKDMYNLKFKLPQELGNLEQLERLFIDNCFLETLPESLCFLQELRYLSIRNNFIKAIPKGVLELPILCEFYAEGNQLKKEQKRLAKIIKERPDFITAQKIDLITRTQESENNINSTLLAPEVIAELVRLGIRSEEVESEERYFTPVDCEDEMMIGQALVQLLWGFDWNKKKLMWKEPPFSCDETWNDEAYLEGDEDYLQRERCLEISYAFYSEESFCIGEEVYLAIGYFQSSGQPYRICISLKDEQMENPEVFVHDYLSEEPSNFGSLSTFLHKLTTEEMWEEEYTSMNLQLFYQDEKSNKFWEIKVIGKCHEIRFGKTGSEGQKKVKEFDTAQIAFKEANRLVAEKKNKGYQE